MGIYLNPDFRLFKRALNSQGYVDKSMLIRFTNSRIDTEQEYICVSRPRRFGKSITANMLTAYYSRGCDSRRIFSELKIAKGREEDTRFEENLNKYNVIRLNIQDFYSREKTVKECIGKIERDVIKELKKEYPRAENGGDSLMDILYNIYSENGCSFIFIIDEWDCIFRMKKNSDSEIKIYLDFIRGLLKDKPYVSLAYMTGILPIKKYGEHSALNMFREYSMINQRELAEFTGFTEQEAKELCERFDVPFEEVKRWYNGYNVMGIDIYNPCSVSEAITSRVFDSYWLSTETYEALRNYISMDLYGLHDKVTRLISGECIPVDTTAFRNDMTGINSADDVFTLLIHLGYLTYDKEKGTVRIPNNEIRNEYITSVKRGGWENVTELINRSEELLNAVLSVDEEKTALLLEQAHQDNTSILKYNDENALSCVIALAFFSANNDYTVHREFPSGKGFADMVFIPRKNSDKPALIVELKHNDTAENALKQIKEKDYADSLKGFANEALLVGLSYGDNKKHECRIEKYFYKN